MVAGWVGSGVVGCGGLTLAITTKTVTAAVVTRSTPGLGTGGVSRMVGTVALRRGTRVLINNNGSKFINDNTVLKRRGGFIPNTTNAAMTVPHLNVPAAIRYSNPTNIRVSTRHRNSDHDCFTANFPVKAYLTSA